PGGTTEVAPGISVEFVHVTHSIPHSSLVAIHGPDGTLLYANDFKFDDFPGIGKKTDYKRLKELGEEGVKCMVVESTRVAEERRTASEKIVRTMLLDNLVKADEDKGLVLTTFSSHIARLNTIITTAQLMDRKPVLLGRSMGKYSGIAEKLGIITLPKNVETYANPKAVKKAFKRMADEGKEKYILIVTGHQGEPDAMLSRMANRAFDYTFERGDQVIFSADVIPNPMNVANRYALETKLRIQGAHLIKDLHVSGHASREDHRDLLRMVNPENIIPCHGDLQMQASYAELAEEYDYEFNKNLFLVRNGQKAKL
ncbi:MAG: MBL fold metallo-hydrolase RNA specificity domain-containing protein, partial [Candidatus Hydrothermarchaeales archaeon]